MKNMINIVTSTSITKWRTTQRIFLYIVTIPIMSNLFKIVTTLVYFLQQINMHHIIFYMLEFRDVETILYREPIIIKNIGNTNWSKWQSWKILHNYTN